jgi:hypothetical protein
MSPPRRSAWFRQNPQLKLQTPEARNDSLSQRSSIAVQTGEPLHCPIATRHMQDNEKNQAESK